MPETAVISKPPVQTGLQGLEIFAGGLVQGVGFRPFIYRLAHETGVAGWVKNTPRGVQIRIEGSVQAVESFCRRLKTETPPLAAISSLQTVCCDPAGYISFEIRDSGQAGDKTALIMPDAATCQDCVQEIFDPVNRRYLYPFTNCTNCGPRYSIIESLPYDRQNSSMKKFRMCETCRREYEDPLNRRFHAQPNACPECGPHLELWSCRGELISDHNRALLEAVERIKAGEIAAVKGIGGFHLMADARNGEAISRLRKRKNRPEKPFALMYPSLEKVITDCRVNPVEKQLLQAYESPIVLLKRKLSDDLSPSIAGGSPYYGIMLPYSPLHHLLMRLLGFPIAATSGNYSDDPVCTDENEALAKLGRIADFLLVHNRPIIRRTDDSIVRVVLGRKLVLRRARGYAPLPVTIENSCGEATACGGHQKNTVAAAKGKDIFLSPHLGDLSSRAACDSFRAAIENLHQTYNLRPGVMVCDQHPEYFSSKYAGKSGLPVIKVQHHYAHILSCMADNRVEGPVLGVCWDGTGYGDDGTIWGGEFLTADKSGYRRAAHFRTFPLPGGEKAVTEPRRCALGLLHEMCGDDRYFPFGDAASAAFTAVELKNLRRMLKNGLNSPRTSSAGRLFDAAASIMNVRQRVSYEGQAGMELEYLAERVISSDSYSFKLKDGGNLKVIDWEPMFIELSGDLRNGVSRQLISARFHNTLIEIIYETALSINQKKVVLSGGCFQNKYLLENSVRRLMQGGFEPYWHHNIPPNDGGIALGQIIAAGSKTGA